MHGPIQVKGPLWPIAVLLHTPPPPEEGEEIVPAKSYVPLYSGSWPLPHTGTSAGCRADLFPPQVLLGWEQSWRWWKWLFKPWVHLTGRKLRCMWRSEPDIRVAGAGIFYMMGAHGISVAWEWNPLFWGLPWCILLSKLSASHIFWHIHDGKGCSRAKYKSIWCIKEKRLKRCIMKEKSLTCFLWERRHFLHRKKLNGSVCIQN